MNRLKKVSIVLSVIALSRMSSVCCMDSDKILSAFQPTNRIECVEQYNFAKTVSEQKKVPKTEGTTKEQEADKTENNTKNKETPKKKAIIKKSQEKKAEIVYITEAGECYHKNGCKHLRRSKIAIDKKKAITKYRPCKDCMPGA